MALFYYTTVCCFCISAAKCANNVQFLQAMQTIALFGLKLNRFPAALGALTFFLLCVYPSFFYVCY